MQFQLAAAPLEKYSSLAFRALCHKYGATRVYTEMTRVDALARNNKSSWKKIQTDSNVPTAIQILPSNEKSLLQFCQLFKQSQTVAREMNINVGCPSKHIIRDGLGCAMVKRIAKLERCITMLRQELQLPVTIKIRLGMNANEKQHKIYLPLIAQTSADAYIVHARHGRQTSDSPADWSVFSECVATGKTIIANGDINTVEHVRYLQSQGVAGVMIGRAAVQSPLLFAKCSNMKLNDTNDLIGEYLSLLLHYESTPLEKPLMQHNMSQYPHLAQELNKRNLSIAQVHDEHALICAENFLRHYCKQEAYQFTSG